MDSALLFLPEVMIFLPLCCFLLLSALQLLRPRSEAQITLPISWVMLAISAFSLANIVSVIEHGGAASPLFTWYHIGHITYSFALVNNLNNALFAGGFMVIIAIVGFFAKTYLHREESFFTFFVLYLLFVAFTGVVVFSANLDTLIIGWEAVGLCSVLLIAFYRKRQGPLTNSLFTLVSYRIGEMAFFCAIIMMHIYREGTFFPLFAELHRDERWIVGLIIGAILVKSAQWPFCSWLPRAMEGPTPSSAILYGGISTHFGPLLLLKMMPYLSSYTWVTPLLMVSSVITMAFAAAVGRTRNDIKTQLAYATIAQLGVIYFEIALGWHRFALFHSLAHCSLRTFQFLKSPSYLQEYRQLQIERSGFFVESLYPKGMQKILYYAAHRKFFLEQFIDVILLEPFFALSRRIIAFEHRLRERGHEEVAMSTTTVNSLVAVRDGGEEVRHVAEFP